MTIRRAYPDSITRLLVGKLRRRIMTLFGIDRLLGQPELRKPLEGQRVALPPIGVVTRDLTHSLDALAAVGVNLTAAFGPQHGCAATSKTIW